jgi:hypothetical protein
LASFGKSGAARAEFPPPRFATLGVMEASVTIPFPDDLFDALAQRVAAILSEQPAAQLLYV